jgi:carbon monoxide dehydrogenase subunit G
MHVAMIVRFVGVLSRVGKVALFVIIVEKKALHHCLVGWRMVEWKKPELELHGRVEHGRVEITCRGRVEHGRVEKACTAW